MAHVSKISSNFLKVHLVVEFTNTAEVAVIPSNWLDGVNSAYWPPYISKAKVDEAIQKREEPTSSWRTYSVRILYECHDSYEKVKSKLPVVEGQSVLQTEQIIARENHRPQRTGKRRKLDDGSSTDIEAQSSLPVSMSLPSSPASPSSPVSKQKSVAHQKLSRHSSTQDSRSKLLARPPKLPNPPSYLESSKGSSATGKDEALFTMLNEIKTELSEQRDMLTTILFTLKGGSPIDATLPEELQFPLIDIAAVHDLERHLACSDTELRAIAYLSTVGGFSVQDITRRLLRHTISQGLAMQCNWTGKGDKLGFRDLKLRSVFLKVVRRNPETRNATNAEIEKVMKDWLRLAADRDGGRKRRKERESENM